MQPAKSPRPDFRSGASSLAFGRDDIAPEAARARVQSSLIGDSASGEALARLHAAICEMRAAAAQPLLERAIAAIRSEEPQAAAELSLKALELDERNGLGWYLLAIAREKSGDFKSSIQCYETALQLIPDQVEIANDLGRLAYRLNMKEVAERLFAHFLTRYPDSAEAANNLACALRDQNRYEEAVEVLRPAINSQPQDGMLWNTLGTVLAEQGEPEAAITFFDEALRVDRTLAKARYNRGNAKLALGDMDGALADCEASIPRLKPGSDQSMMKLARATMLVAQGRLAEGWDAYEERLDANFAEVTHFMIDRPSWTPQADVEGRSVLLMGEQGLGDEVLFANLVPDLVQAIGPAGQLHLAVEPRLVSLFQRSFPQVKVGAHATYRVDTHTVRGAPFVKDQGAIDLWAPMASPLRRFRRALDAYPARDRFLVPDPVRVAHWRAVLDAASPQPKVGVLWKSLKTDGARLRYYSPFEQWAPVLAAPGLFFVNMQYGDCSAEIAEAAAQLGVQIWQPPGIDLKQDLDEVAALSCALDLSIGPANATTNIAAACGAPVWLISTPGAWPRLGTDRYPWYPQARVFTPPAFNQWAPVMQQIAHELGVNFGRPGTQALS